MRTITPIALHFSCLLRNIHRSDSTRRIKQVHAQLVTQSFQSDITLQTDLVLAYTKSTRIIDAHKVFDKMPEKSIHSWNILIGAFVQNSLFADAFSVFRKYFQMGYRPDHYTLPSLLKLCVGIRESYRHAGQVFHGFVICLGYEHHVVVGCAALDFYIKCDNGVDSRRIFDSMVFKDVVVWNTMLYGLCRIELYDDALACFKNMILEGVEMDLMTIPSVVNACGGQGDLVKAKEVHGKVIRCLDRYRDAAVDNALIDMYAKCGCLPYSESIFRIMDARVMNVVTWTTMMSCYGHHGKGEESLLLFKKMLESGFKPNSVTITTLLASCVSSGLIDEGRKLFHSIESEYGIEPSVEHYACMVNLLGRFGYLDQAFNLTKEMKLRTGTASVWGALLANCMVHKNVEIGELAAKHLFVMEPTNASNYRTLCSIYESRGMWDKVSRIKAGMRELGLVKTPGCSWMTLEGKVHRFYQGDVSHLSNQLLLDSLDRITNVIGLQA